MKQQGIIVMIQNKKIMLSRVDICNIICQMFYSCPAFDEKTLKGWNELIPIISQVYPANQYGYIYSTKYLKKVLDKALSNETWFRDYLNKTSQQMALDIIKFKSLLEGRN